VRTFRVIGIDWDMTVEDGELEASRTPPTSAIVMVEDEEDIADALSDKTGWCVNSFDSEEIQAQSLVIFDN
jgi:hypothetical protein